MLPNPLDTVLSAFRNIWKGRHDLTNYSILLVAALPVLLGGVVLYWAIFG